MSPSQALSAAETVDGGAATSAPTDAPAAAADASFEQTLMLRVEILILELLKQLNRCHYDLTQLTPADSVEVRFTTPKTYFDAEMQQWRRERTHGYSAQKDNTYKLPGSDGGKQLGEWVTAGGCDGGMQRKQLTNIQTGLR